MPRSSAPLVAALVLLASLAVLAGPSGAQTEAKVAPCEGYQVVASQGPSCPIEGGWRVLLPDGTTVDTHGPDEIPAGRASLSTGGGKSANPACVNDPAGQFHSVMVYAFPADKPDRTAEMTPVLRDLVGQANGFLRAESAALGAAARYKFRCDSPGVVTVLSAALPRSDADTTFATLIADLRAMGHNSVYAKYWVWYDGTRGTLSGQGQIFNNSKLTSANGNALGNTFAVVWGIADPMMLVHESAHMFGAVQKDAPHTSGAYHCTDGLDVMCYFDSPESAYDAGVCADRVHLDCNHDDYFHPDPAPGSYLATHWNMAHRYNRFLDFGRANTAPVVVPFTCVPAVVDHDQPTVCKVHVDDDSDGVSFQVSVDGAPGVRHPATGHMPPGRALVLTHSWGALGNHTITVTPTDDARKPLTGAAYTAVVRVGCALERTGNLTAGFTGIPNGTGVAEERGVPRACDGASYQLVGSLGSDVDLCWHDALGVQLSCSAALGDERGTIPPGARTAKVWLKAGAASTYALKGW